MKKEFNFSGVANLKLAVACNVEINEGPVGHLIIEADGDEKAFEKIKFSQSDNVISIKYREQTSSSINIMGSQINFIHSDNFADKIIVNGVDVTKFVKDEQGKTGKESITKLTITLPKQSELNAEIEGSAVVKCNVELGEVKLGISGASNAKFVKKIGDLKAEISGASHLNAIMSGALKIESSGVTQTSIQGEFTSARVKCSGTSRVETNGVCAGKYKAEASGVSRIHHQGRVLGHISKDKSGLAKISIS